MKEGKSEGFNYRKKLPKHILTDMYSKQTNKQKNGKIFTEMLLVSRWPNDFKIFLGSEFSEVLITLRSEKQMI